MILYSYITGIGEIWFFFQLIVPPLPEKRVRFSHILIRTCQHLFSANKIILNVNNSWWWNYYTVWFFFLQINIAALRIAADKFDPDFIDKRKVALEVRYKCQISLCFTHDGCPERFCCENWRVSAHYKARHLHHNLMHH